MKLSFLLSTIVFVFLGSGLCAPALAQNHYANGLKAELNGNASKAIEHYHLSADQGVSDANFAIARLLEADGDDSGAFEHYSKAAKAGNSFAQYSLGMGYKTGTSAMPSDGLKSLYWLSQAAKKGHGEAALEAYLINSDESLLLLAADQGVHDAITLMAKSYQLGLNGFEKSSAKSDLWLEKMSSDEDQE